MDDSDSSIIFDNDGVCDHCNNFYKHTLVNWNLQKADDNGLEALSNRIREAGKGKDFDCPQ